LDTRFLKRFAQIMEQRIRARLDGGFAHLQLLASLDNEPGVEYVVGMAKNAVLKRKAKRAMRQVRKLSRHSGKTEHIHREANYAAKTWPHERSILIKAEVVRARRQRAQRQPALCHHQYEAKPARDLRKGLLPAGRNRESDKGTVRVANRPHQLQRFLGHHFRVLLTAAAYVLMQELPHQQESARKTKTKILL